MKNFKVIDVILILLAIFFLVLALLYFGKASGEMGSLKTSKKSSLEYAYLSKKLNAEISNLGIDFNEGNQTITLLSNDISRLNPKIDELKSELYQLYKKLDNIDLSFEEKNDLINEILKKINELKVQIDISIRNSEIFEDESTIYADQKLRLETENLELSSKIITLSNSIKEKINNSYSIEYVYAEAYYLKKGEKKPSSSYSKVTHISIQVTTKGCIFPENKDIILCILKPDGTALVHETSPIRLSDNSLFDCATMVLELDPGQKTLHVFDEELTYPSKGNYQCILQNLNGEVLFTCAPFTL